MDSLKKPDVLLSVGTAAGLVISVGYFYKQLLSIQDDMKSLRENVSMNAKQIAKMQAYNKAIHQIGTVVKDMNTQQDKINKELLKNKRISYNVEDYFNTMRETLKSKDIELPEYTTPRISKPVKSSRSRRKQFYDDIIEDDYSSDESDCESNELEQLENIRRQIKARRR